MKKKAILLLPSFILRFAAGAQSIEEQQESSWYNSPIVWIILSAIALFALVVTTQNRKNNKRNKHDD